MTQEYGVKVEGNPPVVTVSMLGSLSSRPFTELTVTWYVLPGIMLASRASNTPPSTVTVIGLPAEEKTTADFCFARLFMPDWESLVPPSKGT